MSFTDNDSFVVVLVQDKLSEAINALDSGDPAGALGKVNIYLEENKLNKRLCE